MPNSAPQNTAASAGRSSVWRLVWNIASVSGRILLLGCLAVCVASPELIDLDWRFDIVASLIAQACLAGAVLAIWQALFRRWVWCALFAVVAAGGYSWMLRVERAPTTAQAHLGPGAIELELLIMNVHSRNQRGAEVLSVIEDSGADIVVIIESSWWINRDLAEHGGVTQRYPYRAGTDKDVSGQIVVLSRHPLFKTDRPDSTEGLTSSWGYRAGFVDVQGQRIGFSAVHPASPRTRNTWLVGQHTFGRLARHYERVGIPLGARDHPMIIAGDLNSSPTSLRTRLVTRDLGLLRAKPLSAWDGTFPASLPWFARSSIDGAFVTPGVTISDWSTLQIPGSDHRGVSMSLVVEAEPGG